MAVAADGNNLTGVTAYRGGTGYLQTGANGRYATFATPSDSIAASIGQFQRYQANPGAYGATAASTPAQLIHIYAPSADGNNEQAYAASIQRQTGLDPNQPINLSDPATAQQFVTGVATVETGRTPDPSVVQQGVATRFGSGSGSGAISGPAPSGGAPQGVTSFQQDGQTVYQQGGSYVGDPGATYTLDPSTASGWGTITPGTMGAGIAGNSSGSGAGTGSGDGTTQGAASGGTISGLAPSQVSSGSAGAIGTTAGSSANGSGSSSTAGIHDWFRRIALAVVGVVMLIVAFVALSRNTATVQSVTAVVKKGARKATEAAVA